MRTLLIGAGALALIAVAGAARAEILHFRAVLDGASEVPPLHAPGKGVLSGDLDTRTRKLHYRLEFSGLSGPATGAHIHGPAASGVNGPPLVMLSMEALTSPKIGSETLTRGQVADLEAGRLYVNVHTGDHPDGEIRGQLLPAKP